MVLQTAKHTFLNNLLHILNVNIQCQKCHDVLNWHVNIFCLPWQTTITSDKMIDKTLVNAVKYFLLIMTMASSGNIINK